MQNSSIETARSGSAPMITHCIVIGEGTNVRLAFMAREKEGEPASLLSAVTLTRNQLDCLAAMIDSVLDADDAAAVSVN